MFAVLGFEADERHDFCATYIGRLVRRPRLATARFKVATKVANRARYPVF
jgi:hypothetical protein